MVVFPIFALNSRPGRAWLTRVWIGDSPSLIGGHGVHDFEESFRFRGKHYVVVVGLEIMVRW